VFARSQVLRAVALFAALIAAWAGSAAASYDVPEREYVRAALEMSDLSLDAPVDPTADPLGATAVLAGSRTAAAGSGATSSALGVALASAAAGESDPKNPMVALLMSAAVPGLGELYTGNTARAKAFLSAEAAIWIGFAAFTVQENMRIEDYEEYAHTYAGIPEGSSSDYYQDVADYIRSEGDDSFNEDVRAEARSLYPDDLEAQDAYLTANGYFGSASWEWESGARFSKYRGLRTDASTSRRNAFYMTGLAFLNRAISAIDSMWMARRHNSGLSGEPRARLYLSPDLSEDYVGSRLGLEVSF
jgi:hypothetical protein